MRCQAYLALLVFTFACNGDNATNALDASTADAEPLLPSAPAELLGTFIDDYAISYSISETRWQQEPDTRYEIQEWNAEEHYLIAQNHKDNPSDALLWTRIDWVELADMPDYPWAFCYSAYNANSSEEARLAQADTQNPRTGCNGFPFSRMMPTQ